MGTHPIFESDFDCLTVLRSKRFKNDEYRRGESDSPGGVLFWRFEYATRQIPPRRGGQGRRGLGPVDDYVEVQTPRRSGQWRSEHNRCLVESFKIGSGRDRLRRVENQTQPGAEGAYLLCQGVWRRRDTGRVARFL